MPIVRLRSARFIEHSFRRGLIFQSSGLCHLCLLDEVFLQHPSVARIGLEQRVGHVAQERHQADREVHDNVEQHARLDRLRQAALDLIGFAVDEKEGHEAVNHISNAGVNGQYVCGILQASPSRDGGWVVKDLPRNQADNRAPPEFDATKVDSTIEPVCSFADSLEDGLIVR